MEGLTELVEVTDDEPFVLHPGEFVLGQTLESIALPDDIVARLEGKSSLGRLGLLIHSTAGFVDPSWEGNLTLELSNVRFPSQEGSTKPRSEEHTSELQSHVNLVCRLLLEKKKKKKKIKQNKTHTLITC